MGRRDFLNRGWKAGVALIGAAAAWTTWDLLRPLPGSALGGSVKTIAPSEVPTNTTVYVQAAQTFLTRIGDDVVALRQKCPHLGCTVSWCENAGEFECPCHGSTFNRAGEVRSGPSPRGLDRYAVTVSDDFVDVNTGEIIEGAPPGPESIDEPRRGEGCTHG